MLFIKTGLSTFGLLRDAVCRLFHLVCKTNLGVELVTSLEEGKFQGDSKCQAFIQSVACGKANTELFLKKKTFSFLGFRFCHWKCAIRNTPCSHSKTWNGSQAPTRWCWCLFCSLADKLLLPQGLPQFSTSGSCGVWCS